MGVGLLGVDLGVCFGGARQGLSMAMSSWAMSRSLKICAGMPAEGSLAARIARAAVAVSSPWPSWRRAAIAGQDRKTMAW